MRCLHAQAAGVAVRVDALAVHVFQDQVRLALGRDARVDQLRDVRVPEAGQDAALAAEAPLAVAAHQARVQQLHGRLAAETAVAALRQPDAAHAALPDR